MMETSLIWQKKNLEIEEAEHTTNRTDPKQPTPRHIVRLLKRKTEKSLRKNTLPVGENGQNDSRFLARNDGTRRSDVTFFKC